MKQLHKCLFVVIDELIFAINYDQYFFFITLLRGLMVETEECSQRYDLENDNTLDLDLTLSHYRKGQHDWP